MVAEVFAGISAAKNAFDLARAIKDIDDAARRNSAIIDLQNLIITARDTQSALLDRIDELKKEVASFEKWETEKERYELVSLGVCTFAYMLKPDARGSAPPHWVCAKCFGDRHIELIQEWTSPKGAQARCPRCKTSFEPDDVGPDWIDH